MNTITLQAKGSFHSHKGRFDHEQLLGQPEGIVITNTEGVEYLALRPLLSDYVLSMPRGAQVIYPKDAGQIVAMADIFPGARVIEAGVGSGGLTLALLRAIGESGELHSIEIRPEFAEVARGNVRTFFGETPDTWRVHLGAFADVANKDFEPSSVDRVVLDMLAPWENLAAAARVLTPGGVFCAYVATTTQLSRLAEDLRVSQCFTEPVAFETMVRTWHLEGLAVRPDHRMIGHTGFLLIARRMAVGVKPPLRRRRPAKGAYPVAADAVAAEAVAAEAGEAAGPGVAGEPGAASGTFSIAASPISADLFSAEFTEDAMEVRPVAERKLRRVLRELGGSDES
jgi:tRNA (adenine57-N1/adenine58-N1)-methyltransferase